MDNAEPKPMALVASTAESAVAAEAMLRQRYDFVAPEEAESVVATALPRRERESATLFHLRPEDAKRLAHVHTEARLLARSEYPLLDNLPPVLRGELRDACRYSPIASVFLDGRPVSFCYSGWETESHWDLSIDTLEAFRRRGFGLAACVCLIKHFARLGKTAVWGSLESNPESTALACKLGFTPVDRLLVAYPDRAHHS